MSFYTLQSWRAAGSVRSWRESSSLLPSRGVPYALLLGPFSGVIEIVPIVGPLLAGGAAIGLALTVSWQLALETAQCSWASG
jgi:hypothetical protein